MNITFFVGFYFKYGTSAFVSSNTNFVGLDGDKAVVQVAFNVPFSGPNGLGGITVDGNASNYKVNAARKSKVDDNTARMQSIKQLGV